MAFTRANPIGWANGETFTAAQANQIDTNQSKAVDGTGGGSYMLTAPLTLDGDTVSIPEVLVAPNIHGVTTFNADVVAGQDLIVAADLTVQGKISGDAPLRLYTGTTSATISLLTYNYAIMNPAATITLTIAAGAYVRGHYITVHNRAASAGNTVAVRDPALSTVVTIPGAGKWADIVYDGTSWVLARASL